MNVDRLNFIENLKVSVEDMKSNNENKQYSYDPNKRNILIGGAWPYANNSLHLGHLAALISGDFLARYHRQIGDNVIYVSGTDCHGTPITERARNEGRTPKEVSDYYHSEFVKTFDDMNFSYDLYTKTTDDYHQKSVMELFKKMYDNGHIQEQKDMQSYCGCCKKFVADREIQLICPACNGVSKGDQCDCGYVPTVEDQKDATCQICKEKVIYKENNNLYLKLSEMQPEITDYVRQNEANWRTISKTETEKYLTEGLRDRAVTRDMNWGVNIPVEGYDNKRMYVWIDAVLGYITATQKFCEENDLDWQDFWKRNDNNKIYMAHGKDNITFHTIILPALLLATKEKYNLPDTMVTSQYLNIDSEKISKSKGNGITVNQMIKDYNIDSLRYYLLSNGPEKRDSNFSLEDFVLVHNADVTNKYGNFVNRTLRYKGLEEVPNGTMDAEIKKLVDEAYIQVEKDINELEFKKAIARIMNLVEIGNKYYDERKPWVQKKENEIEFNNTIYTCTNLIANLSNLLEPVMPESSHKIREYFGIEKSSWEQISVQPRKKLENIEPLFERVKLSVSEKKDAREDISK